MYSQVPKKNWGYITFVRWYWNPIHLGGSRSIIRDENYSTGKTLLQKTTTKTKGLTLLEDTVFLTGHFQRHFHKPGSHCTNINLSYSKLFFLFLFLLRTMSMTPNNFNGTLPKQNKFEYFWQQGKTMFSIKFVGIITTIHSSKCVSEMYTIKSIISPHLSLVFSCQNW